MTTNNFDTVLLVCNCEQRSAEILSDLFESGFNVVGPVSDASMALAMAAQTNPTIAVVATPPTGSRNARQLAQELKKIWGIRSWILERTADREQGRRSGWRASNKRVSHIRGALTQEAGREAA